MANRTRAAREALALLRREYHGVLSTLSVDVPGYPFGSIVPYALDREGRPVILISRIAQHTKNIEADPRVSLIVSQGGADDVQSAPRLTWLADAIPVPDGDEETPARYYRYFPDAQGYHRVHDFDFYRLAPVRARFIGGFGEIHWVDASLLLRPNPFTEDQELGMVRHMNEDHVEAMIKYCDAAHIPLVAGIIPAMAGVDADGFHLRPGARIVRFEFPAPVATPLEVRAALVAIARRDRARRPLGLLPPIAAREPTDPDPLGAGL